MAEELRRDPLDGKVYTFAELSSYYAGEKFSKKAIKAYWSDECKPVVAAKAKAKAKAKVKELKEKVKASKKEVKETKKDIKKESKETKTNDKEWIEKPSGLCVCGEGLIDFLPCTTPDFGGSNAAFRPAFGGSPFNCCIAATRLGIPTTFLGGLSTDMFGEQLYKHLESQGVDVSSAVRLPNPTTLAFVSRGAGGEQYAFFKENAADRSLTKAHVAKALKDKRFRAVHMSLGAVTLEHAGCTAAFQTLFAMAGKAGSLRSFDPNIRANMISETPAKYSKRIEKLLKSVELVKTSDEDAEFLYGEGVDLNEIATKWLKLGPKMVVLTMGAKGAAAFVSGPDSKLIRQDIALPAECAGKKTINKEGKFVDVADTVGAGDTFMGGLITGCIGSSGSSLLPQLVEKKPWAEGDAELIQDVLKLAVTAAALNCSRTGCDPPTLADAEKNVLGGPFKHLSLHETAA